MSDNRYRVIYGETHDTVHILDDETGRKFIGYFGSIDELNMQNKIIETLLNFIKDNGKELIRIEEDYEVNWMVTTFEDIANYSGEADIKTYEEFLESLKR